MKQMVATGQVCLFHSLNSRRKIRKRREWKNHMTSTALMSPLRRDQSIDRPGTENFRRRILVHWFRPGFHVAFL